MMMIYRDGQEEGHTETPPIKSIEGRKEKPDIFISKPFALGALAVEASLIPVFRIWRSDT
jgi:hypothetical protein